MGKVVEGDACILFFSLALRLWWVLDVRVAFLAWARTCLMSSGAHASIFSFARASICSCPHTPRFLVAHIFFPRTIFFSWKRLIKFHARTRLMFPASTQQLWLRTRACLIGRARTPPVPCWREPLQILIPGDRTCNCNCNVHPGK